MKRQHDFPPSVSRHRDPVFQCCGAALSGAAGTRFFAGGATRVSINRVTIDFEIVLDLEIVNFFYISVGCMVLVNLYRLFRWAGEPFGCAYCMLLGVAHCGPGGRAT